MLIKTENPKQVDKTKKLAYPKMTQTLQKLILGVGMNTIVIENLNTLC